LIISTMLRMSASISGVRSKASSIMVNRARTCGSRCTMRSTRALRSPWTRMRIVPSGIRSSLRIEQTVP
jgi:hypothetical protein